MIPALQRYAQALERRLRRIRRRTDILRFREAVRTPDNFCTNLPDAVLDHLFEGDDKGAFVAWFEGRPDYVPDDWHILLLVARTLHPTLFPVDEIPAETVAGLRRIMFGANG